ncbi:unnamed protein product [Polarella glacialis]|uniref:RING-type domain-containing protein n=2 Tax=Polarella glacialis TaxID=89957 RepID=A0A813KMJ1_POLGL|nr:unnamed protein product [Polarella glacialis]
MQVRLVADTSVSLFSTDFRPWHVKEASEQRPHGACQCQVQDVACCCGSQVGYHVIQPCEACGTASHNDHYWLFDKGNMAATARQAPDGTPVVWTGLSVIAPADEEETEEVIQAGKVEVAESATGQQVQIALPQNAPIELCCPICHDLISDPTAPPCGHAACQRCLTRAVDLRRECPCCRLETTCAALQPATAMAQRLAAYRASLSVFQITVCGDLRVVSLLLVVIYDLNHVIWPY